VTHRRGLPAPAGRGYRHHRRRPLRAARMAQGGRRAGGRAGAGPSARGSAPGIPPLARGHTAGVDGFEVAVGVAVG